MLKRSFLLHASVFSAHTRPSMLTNVCGTPRSGELNDIGTQVVERAGLERLRVGVMTPAAVPLQTKMHLFHLIGTKKPQLFWTVKLKRNTSNNQQRARTLRPSPHGQTISTSKKQRCEFPSYRCCSRTKIDPPPSDRWRAVPELQFNSLCSQ